MYRGSLTYRKDSSGALTDFGARLYSPPLRRWLTPDPLGEKYYDISPYAYCAGDPVNAIDDGGLDIVVKGRNASSIIFRTSIDKEFNLPFVDFRGNYQLEGKEVLSAALDIAGILDQSGVADGINAALQFSTGITKVGY